MWADAHCHLSDERIFSQRIEWIQNAQKNGIQEFYLGGYSPEEWDRQKILTQEFPNSIFPVFGLHPWWIAKSTETECNQALSVLRSLLPTAVALGETGLDFFPKIPVESHALQINLFKKQIALAIEFEKPLVLHIVNAHKEALEILDRYDWSLLGLNQKGMIHAFQGGPEIAEEYLKRGWSLSVGAKILSSSSKPILEALEIIPLDQLMIESDASGQDRPEVIIKIAEKVGDIKKLTTEQVLDQSRINLRKIFQRSTG